MLVCDDVAAIRRLVRINLELAGFTVEAAADRVIVRMRELIADGARAPEIAQTNGATRAAIERPRRKVIVDVTDALYTRAPDMWGPAAAEWQRAPHG